MKKYEILLGTDISHDLLSELSSFSESQIPGSRMGQRMHILQDDRQLVAIARSEKSSRILGFYCMFLEAGSATLHTLRVDAKECPGKVASRLQSELLAEATGIDTVQMPLGRGGSSQDDFLRPDRNGFKLNRVFQLFIADIPPPEPHNGNRKRMEDVYLATRRDIPIIRRYIKENNLFLLRDVHWKGFSEYTLEKVIDDERVYLLQKGGCAHGVLFYEVIEDQLNSEKSPGKETYSLEIILYATSGWKRLLRGFLMKVGGEYTCIRCFSHLGILFQDVLKSRRPSRYVFAYSKK